MSSHGAETSLNEVGMTLKGRNAPSWSRNIAHEAVTSSCGAGLAPMEQKCSPWGKNV
ncbi:hypothetical protein Nmel_018912, partial [Mimus melanotis]